MGGTTAKVSMILGGEPRVTKDYTVGAEAQSGVGAFGGADGYPVRTPVIDLVEIGAGGGSIAWVDSGGALRVGPRSAGADPGPACYGLGGTQPTITDANLVLGTAQPRLLCRWLYPARPGSLHGGHRGILCQTAGYGSRSGRRRHYRNRKCHDGRRAAARLRAARPRPSGLPAGRVRGRRTRSRRANRAGERNGRRTYTAEPGHRFRPRPAGDRPAARPHSDPPGTGRQRRRIGELDQEFRTLEAESIVALRADTSHGSGVNFRRSVEMRYYGQSFELDIPVPERHIRRRGDGGHRLGVPR